MEVARLSALVLITCLCISASTHWGKQLHLDTTISPDTCDQTVVWGDVHILDCLCIDQ